MMNLKDYFGQMVLSRMSQEQLADLAIQICCKSPEDKDNRADRVAVYKHLELPHALINYARRAAHDFADELRRSEANLLFYKRQWERWYEKNHEEKTLFARHHAGFLRSLMGFPKSPAVVFEDNPDIRIRGTFMFDEAKPLITLNRNYINPSFFWDDFFVFNYVVSHEMGHYASARHTRSLVSYEEQDDASELAKAWNVLSFNVHGARPTSFYFSPPEKGALEGSPYWDEPDERFARYFGEQIEDALRDVLGDSHDFRLPTRPRPPQPMAIQSTAIAVEVS